MISTLGAHREFARVQLSLLQKVWKSRGDVAARFTTHREAVRQAEMRKVLGSTCGIWTSVSPWVEYTSALPDGMNGD